MAPTIEYGFRRTIWKSSRFLSGMKSKYGALPTQTPPWPTAMPVAKLSWSWKTLLVLNCPSPSVSSK